MHRLEMQNRSIPSDIHSFGTEKDSLEAPLIDPVSDVPRSPVKAPHRVLPALLCVVAGIMVFVGGLYMQGRPYADPCVGFEFTICEYTGCYTAKEFFGTLFAILAIPGTLIPIGNFAQVWCRVCVPSCWRTCIQSYTFTVAVDGVWMGLVCHPHRWLPGRH